MRHNAKGVLCSYPVNKINTLKSTCIKPVHTVYETRFPISINISERHLFQLYHFLFISFQLNVHEFSFHTNVKFSISLSKMRERERKRARKKRKINLASLFEVYVCELWWNKIKLAMYVASVNAPIFSDDIVRACFRSRKLS